MLAYSIESDGLLLERGVVRGRLCCQDRGAEAWRRLGVRVYLQLCVCWSFKSSAEDMKQ